jgi:hypothetical protein
VKSIFFGYQPIGRGGVLLVSSDNLSFAENVAKVVPVRSSPQGFLEPHSKNVLPALQVAIPRIFHWLTEGPDWKAATIDWRDGPEVRPVLEPGRPFPITATVTFHVEQKDLTPVLSVLDTRGKPVFRRTGQSIAGTRGTLMTEPFTLLLDERSETGPCTLELAIEDADGQTIDRMARAVEVRHRLSLTNDGPRIANEPGFDPALESLVRFTITDPRPGPIPDGELRLTILNEDTGRRYVAALGGRLQGNDARNIQGLRSALAAPGAVRLAGRSRRPLRPRVCPSHEPPCRAGALPGPPRFPVAGVGALPAHDGGDKTTAGIGFEHQPRLRAVLY